jgi:uncharacterized 2Fe-2S/4Fe-4S cluster protein (DUF4445 family)
VTGSAFFVRFIPDGRVQTFDGPVDLYLAAATAGILVEQPCGAQGTCGRCRVRVHQGAPAPTDPERDCLTGEELGEGWRLGCQLVLRGEAVVEIPTITRSLAGKSFGGDLAPDAIARPIVNAGLVRPPLAPAGSPASSLLDAIAAAAGLEPRSLTASSSALAELASHAGGDAPLRVAVHGRELVAVTPTGPDTRAAEDELRGGCFGLAIDLGTTSLAAALVRLGDGSVAASASSLNPQVAHGADVISRIKHETHVANGAAHLTGAVRQGLADLVSSLLAAVPCAAPDVVVASIAGNPTMMHMWRGVPAASLGRAPYLAAWSDSAVVKASEVALPIHPNANVLVFPMVRSHVGGDAVAAAVASGLDKARGSQLLIDLGTNTELLLAHRGRVFATSAAAGPAFEGVSIRHGMRGAPGAIDVVSFGAPGDVVIHTIGGGVALGLCGSGLIDAIAELRRVGLVSTSGSLRKPGELEQGSPWARRLTQVEGVNAFVLADADASAPGLGGLVVTARDIREVQLVKGSIVAAISLLCRHAGTSPAGLEAILVAGAFGNFIRKTSALRLGLLPAVDAERVRFVGNAAGVGTRLATVDREILERARGLAAGAEYVDLATHPEYHAAFMAALAFPDGPAERHRGPGVEGGQR